MSKHTFRLVAILAAIIVAISLMLAGLAVSIAMRIKDYRAPTLGAVYTFQADSPFETVFYVVPYKIEQGYVGYYYTNHPTVNGVRKACSVRDFNYTFSIK